MGIIYMATNTANGKKYIGQTTRNLSSRRHEHEQPRAGKWSLLSRAIAKYGVASFEWKVLHSGVLVQEMLDQLEKEEIANRNTMAPAGYNMKEGGMGGTLHPDVVARIKAKNEAAGYVRLRAATKTQAWRDKVVPRLQKARMPVRCIDTGVEYVGVREAARLTGTTSSLISRNCHGIIGSASGKHFEYIKTHTPCLKTSIAKDESQPSCFSRKMAIPENPKEATE